MQRGQTTGTFLGWIGLLVAGIVWGIAAFVVDTAVLWSRSTGCEPGPADPHQVLLGQLSLAVVLVLPTATWTLAWVVLVRHRAAALVSALLGVLPALGYLLYGLDSSSWVGGLCIQF